MKNGRKAEAYMKELSPLKFSWEMFDGYPEEPKGTLFCRIPPWDVETTCSLTTVNSNEALSTIMMTAAMLKGPGIN